MQSKGYEQMSVQDVLDELQASRGAFYHYFESKQALLEAVIARMVEAGLGAVAPIVDHPDLSAIAKLERYFSGIGRWKTDRKALVLALLQVWVSDENAIVREKFRRGLVGGLTEILARIVKQGMDEGTFSAASANDTAKAMVVLLLGLQEEATDLFIARQRKSIGYDAVVQAFAGYNAIFERILGVPEGSIHLADETVMRAWFG